jgi:hypothetical protein
MLENGRADARGAGLPGLVGTEIRGENDDVIPGRDTVESVRHGAPAAPERTVDQDEVGRARTGRESRGSRGPDLADDRESVPVQVRGQRV